ncbi:MAG TPA: methyltransferase domain-containing protein [Bryobacteraceae bacterium]|nr:methyltransferase domain-containing protein [Bryobacteraceae bacterium]
MDRRDVVELLENPTLPEEVVADAYNSLARMHHWLGDTAAILNRLRDSHARSVLDLGCGHGALLQEIRRELGVDVIGFDLRPAPESSPVPILAGDAVADPLPRADVALAVCLVHHLSEADIVRLIRNVSKSCGRLIVLDPVRHWLPLWLFRIFVGPFLPPINVADGATSIRRSYTPRELRRIVDIAVQGTGARVRHAVAPLYIRQVIDISWQSDS